MHKNNFIRKENLVLIIMALLLMNISHSFTTSSGNYSSNVTIISSGGTTINSSDQISLTSVSQPAIGMTGCSQYYKNFVGFMYTLNFSYSDDAPETNASLISVADYDSDGNIELNWTDENKECFETYRIYRHSAEINKTNIQNAELIASGIDEGTQFFEDNITLNGTAYWYALVTVDQAGNFNTSFVSNSLNATANDTIMPKQVTNLNVTGSGDTAALRWKHVERDTTGESDFFAMGYNIYRGTSVNLSKTEVNNTGPGFSYLKTVSTNSTTDIISSSGIYHYIVTSIDDADIENKTIIIEENYGNVSLTYTPPSAPAEGGAGGGGGAALTKLRAFSISRTLIRVILKQGESTTKSFIISNTGLLPIELSLDIEGTELASLSDNEISLEPGESKTVNVYIFASENQRPDIYSGRIIISSGNIQKSIGLIIEVLAKKALFDITVNVPEKYKYISKNESAIANISLFNLGDLKPVDVNLYYSLKNLEGGNLTFKLETLAVWDELHITRELKLPQNITNDDYLFYAKVMYGTETAFAADIFHVVEIKPATCFDEMQNQGEEGIDCGGPCEPCEAKEKPFIYIWIFRIFIFLLLLILILILIRIAYTRIRKIREAIIAKRSIKRLEKYIERCIALGIKKSTIKDRLIKIGWNSYYINRAFRKIIGKEIIEMIEKQGEKDILGLYRKLTEKGYSKENLNLAFDALMEKHRKRPENMNKPFKKIILNEIKEIIERKNEKDILKLYNLLIGEVYSNINEESRDFLEKNEKNLRYISNSMDKELIGIIMEEIIEMVEKGEEDVLAIYNKLLEKGYSKEHLNKAFDILLEKETRKFHKFV